MGRLLIVGGRVLDPSSGLDVEADIAIENGVIAEIAPGLSRAGLRPEQVLDAGGCLVTPGLIDPHVHLREPGNERAETIASGTAAAVAGGFTSVCCMPNTTPALDNDSMVYFVQARTEATGVCRVFPVCAASKGRHGHELAEIPLMARAGACGFSDDGDCIASAGLMARVLSACKAVDRPFMQHCQEPTMTRNAAMHAGVVSTRLDLGGWPRVAEELIIERDVRLNRAIGCAYHVQHMSSAGSVEIVAAAQKLGLPVTCEATPHHLLLTCDLIESSGYDTRFKVNPPIREQSDIDALKDAIARGICTVLGTDHAPHTPESKDVPFDQATFGMVGLETALALYAEALIEGNVIDWPRLIAMMTIEPARLCRLDRLGLGSITLAGPADITVIDPSERWTISAATFAGSSRNSPFVGRQVRGRAVATVVAGKVRMSRR